MVTKNNRKEFNKAILKIFPKDTWTIPIISDAHNPIIITRLIDADDLNKLVMLCLLYKSEPTIYCWDTVQVPADKPDEDLEYLVICTQKRHP